MLNERKLELVSRLRLSILGRGIWPLPPMKGKDAMGGQRQETNSSPEAFAWRHQ